MLFILLWAVVCTSVAAMNQIPVGYKQIMIPVGSKHPAHSPGYLVDVVHQGNTLFKELAQRYGSSESLLVSHNVFFDQCICLKKAYGFDDYFPELNDAFNETAVSLVYHARALGRTEYQKKFLKYVYTHMPARSLQAGLSLAQLYLAGKDEKQAQIFLLRAINSENQRAKEVALNLWNKWQKKQNKSAQKASTSGSFVPEKKLHHGQTEVKNLPIKQEKN